MTKEELLTALREHCKSSNKYLTNAYLESLPPERLLGFSHPFYTRGYREKMIKLGLIEEKKENFTEALN